MHPRQLVLALIASLAAAAANDASARSRWPDRAVEVVVGTSDGGAADRVNPMKFKMGGVMGEVSTSDVFPR